MGLPMQYVRKKPKGFGRDAQIEGDIHEGQRVLLVEDLTTDGGSKIRFAEAIRKAGASCDHTVVVFFYDIFDSAPKVMAENGLTLHHLATWADVLGAAAEQSAFDKAALKALQDFIEDPLKWSEDRGGEYVPTH
jgi:orotate phosphoribosyltransferase